MSRYRVDVQEAGKTIQDIETVVEPEKRELLNLKRLRELIVGGNRIPQEAEGKDAPKFVVEVEKEPFDQLIESLELSLVMLSVSDTERFVSTLRSLLQLVEDQPSEEQETAPTVKEVVPLSEVNENLAFFVRKARQYVGEDFFRFNGEDIDFISPETYKNEKLVSKIKIDLHTYLLFHAQVIYKDVGSPLSVATPLVVAGTWYPKSDSFDKNPSRISQSDPKTLDDWAAQLGEVSLELKSLFYEVMGNIVSIMGIFNQSKRVIDLMPKKGKISMENIEQIVEDQSSPPEKKFDASPKRLFEVIQGISGNPFLGSLVREALFIMERTYQGVSYPPFSGSEADRKISSFFPHGKIESTDARVNPDEAYKFISTKLSQHYDKAVSAAENSGADTVFKIPLELAKDKDKKQKFIEIAIQLAFDSAWGYFQALEYDINCQMSSFSEGSNALIYHKRDSDGVPAKTVYDRLDSSKDKIPRVTDVASYYPTILEAVYVPALINYDDIEIEDSSKGIEEYFETYFISKYGSIEERNKSREYLQVLGHLPWNIYKNDNGKIDYEAISRDFFAFRVKPERTPFGTSPDYIFMRKTPQIREGLEKAKDKGNPTKHFAVKLSLSDIFLKGQIPLEDENGENLVFWEKSPSPDTIARNYVTILSYMDQFFMNSADAKKLGQIKISSDIIEWEIDPAIKGISWIKSLVRIFDTASRYPYIKDKSSLALLGMNIRKEGDIGQQLYDKARSLVYIQKNTVPDAFGKSGIQSLTDHLLKYMRGSYAELESKSWPVPRYDAEGNLDVTFTSAAETQPMLLDKTFRNVFVPWTVQPYFASRRAFEARKVIEDNMAKKGRMTDVEAETAKKENNKAEFILELDQFIMPVLSLTVGQYMYKFNPLHTETGDQFRDIRREYHVENTIREAVNSTTEKPVYVLFPDDVAVMTEIFKGYILSRAKKRMDDKNASEQAVWDWLSGIQLPGLVKEDTRLDTWGVTEEELTQSILALFAYNDISSGPNAGAVALDFINSASKGQVGRFIDTRQQIEHERLTRRVGGWFAGGDLRDQNAKKS